MIQPAKYNGINFTDGLNRESDLYDFSLQRKKLIIPRAEFGFLSFQVDTVGDVEDVDALLYVKKSDGTTNSTGVAGVDFIGNNKAIIYFSLLPTLFTEGLDVDMTVKVFGNTIGIDYDLYAYSEKCSVVSIADFYARGGFYISASNNDNRNGFLTNPAFGFFQGSVFKSDIFATEQTTFEYSYKRKKILSSENQVIKRFTFTDLTMYQQNLLKWLCNCQNLTINGKAYQIISEFSELLNDDNTEICDLRADFVEVEQSFFTNAAETRPDYAFPELFFVKSVDGCVTGSNIAAQTPEPVQFVPKYGNFTIFDTKTFDKSPKVPEPIEDDDAVNMNYVDNVNMYPFIGDSSGQKDIRKIISKIQLADGFDKNRKYGIHSFLYHKDSVPNGLLIYISDLTSALDYSAIVCNITIMDFDVSADKSRVYKFVGEPSKKVNICFDPNFVQENIGGGVFLEFDSKVFSNIALSPKDFDETNPGFGDNLLYELNDYSKGKFTILKSDTTGKFDRIGVFTKSTTPANLRVVFESSKNIYSQLYWQSYEGESLITPVYATWNYVDGLYRFSIEINASSTPNNAILFLFILNDDILTEPTWVSIASIREISKINGNQDYINKSIDGAINSVKKISGSRDAMIPITVKMDGTGDFTNIQDAINFAKDASVYKQYDIQIFDDFDVSDMTKLSYVSNPSIKNNSTYEITQPVAFLITKNYVNIRGVGSKKMIRVISPKMLTAASYQFIQTIWLAGNCTLENLDVQINGGRYAIHQESGGYLNSEDLNAKTQLINVDRKHLGNDGYPVGVWESVMAEADGTISGLTREDKNCNFVSPLSIPFYFHSNGEAKNPTHHKFTNCNIQCSNPISASQFNAYYGNIGSGHSDLIEFVGCNVIRFNINNNIRGNEQVLNKCDLWRNGGATLIGHSNSPMVCNVERPLVLTFKTATNNKNINVVGGTAYDSIFGGTLAEIKSTLNSNGLIFGKKRIEEPWYTGGSYIFSLPHRLGNCASEPKSLIINVDGTNYTITFDQNYMTSGGSPYYWNTVPNFSTQSILDYINSLYPSIFTASIGNEILKLYTFPDCMEIAKNNSEDVFFVGSKLVRDYASGVNCWKMAQAGDIVNAICAEQINPDECGKIILSKKAIFENLMIGVYQSTAGTMYKVSSYGGLEPTAVKSEASFIAIDNNFLTGI